MFIAHQRALNLKGRDIRAPTGQTETQEPQNSQFKWAVEFGTDLGLKTAVKDGVGSERDDLITDPGAFAAEDAAVHVPLDQRVFVIDLMVEFLIAETG